LNEAILKIITMVLYNTSNNNTLWVAKVTCSSQRPSTYCLLSGYKLG